MDTVFIAGCGAGLISKSCPTLVTSWKVDHKPPLSMGFLRQEYWSGLPFSSPGDLRNPRIEPASPALEAGSLPTEPPKKPFFYSRLTLNLFYMVQRIEAM